ncbi:hypothetical protein TNCV_3204941 [Trichonephila clavipes]|nr:hypothetical protein TNCV_3204941 [Trichonephila clavipes]
MSCPRDSGRTLRHWFQSKQTCFGHRMFSRPLCFAEKIVAAIIYLDMLHSFLMPIIKENMPGFYLFQHDGVPCHYHDTVTSYLSAEVPVWIGREGVIQ